MNSKYAFNEIKTLAEIKGFASAQYQLGFFYFHNFKKRFGIERDPVKAVEWYQKAAIQGHLMAQYRLAVCYFDGIGIDASAKEAFKWFKKSAESGFNESQRRLASCYYNGWGTRKNYKKSAEWHMIALRNDPIVDEIKELITFERSLEGKLIIKAIHTSVYGDIEGSFTGRVLTGNWD